MFRAYRQLEQPELPNSLLKVRADLEHRLAGKPKGLFPRSRGGAECSFIKETVRPIWLSVVMLSQGATRRS